MWKRDEKAVFFYRIVIATEELACKKLLCSLDQIRSPLAGSPLSPSLSLALSRPPSCFVSRFPSCEQHLEQAACSSAVIADNPIVLHAMSTFCHLYRLLRITRWYHFWDANICQPRDKVCPENCVAPALENTPGHTRPRPLSPLWHGPWVPVVVHLVSIRRNSHRMIVDGREFLWRQQWTLQTSTAEFEIIVAPSGLSTARVGRPQSRAFVPCRSASISRQCSTRVSLVDIARDMRLRCNWDTKSTDLRCLEAEWGSQRMIWWSLPNDCQLSCRDHACTIHSYSFTAIHIHQVVFLQKLDIKDWLRGIAATLCKWWSCNPRIKPRLQISSATGEMQIHPWIALRGHQNRKPMGFYHAFTMKSYRGVLQFVPIIQFYESMVLVLACGDGSKPWYPWWTPK